MIKYIEGDIFSTPAKVIVNTVNTIGIMGKGLALDFKNRYPNMFEQYRKACEKKNFVMGKLMLVYEKDHWILLFPTKENWRFPSKIEYIEKGLQKFRNTYSEKQIDSIAFPRLGCGNGNLDWKDVKPLMEKYLADLPINIYIYSVNKEEDIPEHKMYKKSRDWFLKDAKSLSTNAVIDDIKYQSSIIPIEISYKDVDYSVSFDKNLVFLSNNNSIELTEEEVALLWESTREKGVYKESKDLKIELINILFNKLGYSTKISILSDDEKCSGYQINEGINRLFSFQEDLL